MNNPLRGFMWAGVMLGLLLGACTGKNHGGGSGVPGDVSLHVTTSVLDDQSYRSGGNNVIDLTNAGASGDFTGTFTSPDSGLVFTLKVNGLTVHEGDRVDFPLVSGIRDSDLRMTVVYKGITFSSDRPGPTGYMYFEQLKAVDAAVDIRTSFKLTLSSDGAETLTVEGYFEAHQGSAITDTTP